MSIAFARTDTSVVGRWWWTIDRWLLVAAGVLIAVGMLLTLAAGPPAAERIGGRPRFHFVRKQSVLSAIDYSGHAFDFTVTTDLDTPVRSPWFCYQRLPCCWRHSCWEMRSTVRKRWLRMGPAFHPTL